MSIIISIIMIESEIKIVYCSGERALDNIDEDSYTVSEALLNNVLQEVNLRQTDF